MSRYDEMFDMVKLKCDNCCHTNFELLLCPTPITPPTIGKVVYRCELCHETKVLLAKTYMEFGTDKD